MKKITIRRQSSLKRLQEQLNKNEKPEKVGKKTTTNFIFLTTKDKERIEKEIEVLKQRT